MRRSTVSFQQTPNPNALKCVVDGVIPPLADKSGPRSYAGTQVPAGDALAAAVLAIPGVTHVLIADRWLTVNRASGADWKGIKSAVQGVVREHVPAAEALDSPGTGG